MSNESSNHIQYTMRRQYYFIAYGESQHHLFSIRWEQIQTTNGSRILIIKW